VGAATILHADLDAFYAAVAVRDRPGLRGRPVAVGGGVVLSCTYEARRFGVAGGMPIGEARRRCPSLIVVRGSFPDYTAESRRVMEVFRRFTPQVQPVSIDEAYLDVSGARHLFGPAPRIARSIRAAVREEIGLAVSIGVARTRMLAKIAGRLAKPDGLLVVEEEDEERLLTALPVGEIPGIGPVTADRLSRLGIHTAAELIEAGALHGALREAPFDPRSDHSRVRSGRRVGSVGAQRTFGRDVRDPEAHDRVLLAVAERVAGRMRAKHLAGRSVTTRIRFADFTTITRSVTVAQPVATATALHRLATESLRTVRLRSGLRLLGISVSQLERDAAIQLSIDVPTGDPLILAGTRRALAQLAVEHAVDSVRGRFGRDAVVRAALLDRGRHDVVDDDR
jgi:DNA polymerase-4